MRTTLWRPGPQRCGPYGQSVAGTLLPPGQSYAFTAGAIHNLKADRFVADHGDVTNPAVANALLAAIGRHA